SERRGPCPGLFLVLEEERAVVEGRSSGSRIFRALCLPGPSSQCVGPVASYGVRTRLQRRARAGFSPAPRRWRGAAVASLDPPTDGSTAGGSPSISICDRFYRSRTA